MFCSQCGKKVMDTMLFCPFCGSAIVVPDQEEGEEQRPAEREPEPEHKEEFVPLNLNTNWDHEDVETLPDAEPFQSVDPYVFEDEPKAPTIRIQTKQDEFEATPTIRAQVQPEMETSASPTLRAQLPMQFEQSTTPTLHIQKQPDPMEPVQLEGRVPELNHVQSGRQSTGGRQQANTHVPVKDFNPNDMFLDGGTKDAYDEYDDDDYAYEEPEEGSFFVRHVRGIVALTLFLVLGFIVICWLFSGTGQTALARANLAWRASAYEELAFSAYEEGNYALSGSYYERALARDSDNYSYANSAGVAYFMAEDLMRATEMGKRAVEIDPSRLDGYQLLLRLYPDVATRPWEISSLLQSGYQLTGDESLKME